MGILVWLAAATAAHLITYPIRTGRAQGRIVEWTIAAAASIVAGLVATRLDFGGWNEPGVQAALFAFFTAAAAIGLWRLLHRFRQQSFRDRPVDPKAKGPA